MNRFERSVYRLFHRRQNQLYRVNYTQSVTARTQHTDSELDRVQFYSSGAGTGGYA